MNVGFGVVDCQGVTGSEVEYIDRGGLTHISYVRGNHLTYIFFCKFFGMVILLINPQKRTLDLSNREAAKCPKETPVTCAATFGQQEMLVSIARLQNQHLPKLFVFLGTLT